MYFFFQLFVAVFVISVLPLLAGSRLYCLRACAPIVNVALKMQIMDSNVI